MSNETKDNTGLEKLWPQDPFVSDETVELRVSTEDATRYMLGMIILEKLAPGFKLAERTPEDAMNVVFMGIDHEDLGAETFDVMERLDTGTVLPITQAYGWMVNDQYSSLPPALKPQGEAAQECLQQGQATQGLHNGCPAPGGRLH